MVSNKQIKFSSEIRCREKIDKAHQLYAKLQQEFLSLPAPKFLDALLKATDFRENTRGLPMGEQRLANIKKLQDTSWRLWTQGYHSLSEQLNYVEQIIEQKGKEGEARLDSESLDAVTFMTVHGSKGLEFPVVILADLCSKFRLVDSGYLLYHPEYGLTVRETSKYEKAKALLRAEAISELKRLLYVAITRAKERLILLGSGNQEDYDLDNAPEDTTNWWQWILWGLQHINPSLVEVISDLQEGIEILDAESESETNDSLKITH